jgi:hypothetical protein
MVQAQVGMQRILYLYSQIFVAVAEDSYEHVIACSSLTLVFGIGILCVIFP